MARQLGGASGAGDELLDVVVTGGSLDAGIVVWTTGYRPDCSWIHIPGVAGDGHLIHRRGVTDVPGLYLAGRVTSRTPGRQPAARPASQPPE